MYKLAIFDLDGTILNTIEDLAASGNEICRRHGYPLHSVEEYKYFVGNGIPNLIKRCMPSGLEEQQYKILLDEFIQYYNEHSSEKTSPYDGMVSCLKKLKAAGMILAVNTNKIDSAAKALCQQFYPNIFDIVVGNRSDLPVKPAPDGVFSILKAIDLSPVILSPGSAVFIGDSDVDIMTAANAGIDGIGVDWGFRGEKFLIEHGAKKVVFSPSELYDILMKN